MNTGCQSYIRKIRIPLGFFVLLLVANTAMAQTTDATCTRDSLFLVSPDVIEMKLNDGGRTGMEISWADLDPAQATCAGFIVPDTLGVEVNYEGNFRGSVDRIFRFVCANSGSVGGVPMVADDLALGGLRPSSLRVGWSSLGPAINGSYQGSFNLANNGGLLRLNGSGAWETVNGNLPMTWFQVNITALAEDNAGTLYAGFSGGSIPNSDSKGLFVNSGSGWERIGSDYFTESMIISFIELSPTDSNLIAVGTEKDGLFVSQDSGLTFTQWTVELGPDVEEFPLSFTVSALLWSETSLLVALPNYGVFSSTDGGSTFAELDFKVPQDLDSSVYSPVIPVVRDFTIDPSDPDHFLAGLVFHGVWESFDGGVSWTDLYGDLNVVDPNTAGAWIYSASQVLFDPNDSQIILMGSDQRGLYRTTNGGVNWTIVGANAQPSNPAQLTKFSFAQRSSMPGEILVFEDNWGLIFSTDSGATWNHHPNQPSINRGFNLLASSNGTDYYLGTTYGGIYEVGSLLNLSSTFVFGTTEELTGNQLGLDISVGSGELVNFDTFDLICQTFQGWAVWRALSYDMNNMTLLGIYDKVNPEDCIEGYCGDESYELLPNCYAAKKSACFNFETPDTVRFFDQEVYEGFSYYYAVTSFDYGNTALLTPQNNTNVMAFSSRWDGDTSTPYLGPGNRTYFAVNSMAHGATFSEEEIYVFPNPLREGVGIPGEEGETVVFTNLPAESRVRVFTPAGDDVIDLGPELQIGNNIRWNSRNRELERVSAGVYFYKVEMPQREDYWGRLVVIR